MCERQNQNGATKEQETEKEREGERKRERKRKRGRERESLCRNEDQKPIYFSLTSEGQMCSEKSESQRAAGAQCVFERPHTYIPVSWETAVCVHVCVSNTHIS